MNAATYDLLIIGGGINGAGIARDAAGRGLKVLLCEKDDFAQGTSSRSGKLVHGGLRYLEYYEFRLVREALIEREVLLRIAPHIVWPMRFVLPHSAEQRPAWVVRTGLFLYDHLGGREKLPGSRSLNLMRDPEGAPIKGQFAKGFEYSDCWVDDARLVILNLLDAAARGADIRSRTRAASARRENGAWSVMLDANGTSETVTARILVNAAGPWVENILKEVVGLNAPSRVRLVKGSHIIVRKFWQGSQAYLLQNDDRRVIFVNPYEDDLCLIGTTDVPYEGRAEDVAVDKTERDYLLRAVNRYMKRQLTGNDILAEFSGVRPLYDDKAGNPSAVTRDYVFDVNGVGGHAPLLSVFGGKITTYRKLAEHAIDKLRPFIPSLAPGWTDKAALPGGDIENADFDQFLADLMNRYKFLPPALARHYGRLYGTRTHDLLRDIATIEALGRHFGGLLYEREAKFLVDSEWAIEPDDILNRRTKHRLHLSLEERQNFGTWMRSLA